MVKVEIERKWILDFLDFSKKYNLSDILISESSSTRLYLSTIDPECRVTINSRDHIPRFVVKAPKSNLSRFELTHEIPKEMAAELSGFYPVIHSNIKEYKLPSGYTLVTYSIKETHPSVVYAEIEFSSESEAKAYIPEFVGVDVTGDERYRMSNIYQSYVSTL